MFQQSNFYDLVILILFIFILALIIFCSEPIRSNRRRVSLLMSFTFANHLFYSYAANTRFEGDIPYEGQTVGYLPTTLLAQRRIVEILCGAASTTALPMRLHGRRSRCRLPSPSFGRTRSNEMSRYDRIEASRERLSRVYDLLLVRSGDKISMRHQRNEGVE